MPQWQLTKTRQPQVRDEEQTKALIRAENDVAEVEAGSGTATEKEVKRAERSDVGAVVVDLVPRNTRKRNYLYR